MHPADIQALIKKKGLTQKEIARRLGKSQMSVHNVIHKKAVSRPIMNGLAELLGKMPEQLWPEYLAKRPEKKTSKACGF
jgi:lambda repressor-like predicted transcriptional regulator